MEDFNKSEKRSKEYAGQLAPKWKELIGLIMKERKDGYIQIVDAEFKGLITSVLADFLHTPRKYEDQDIKFDLKIDFTKLGDVLKYMGKSELYRKIFSSGIELEDGTRAKASSSVWDQGTGELKTFMEGGEEIFTIIVKINFVENAIEATIDWGTIKQILPYVDKELGLILAMTTLGNIEVKK
jgi:hypothetical protein